jgi:hypothetical protein
MKFSCYFVLNLSVLLCLNSSLRTCSILVLVLSTALNYTNLSQSHIATDGQSVSLGVKPHLGLMTRYSAYTHETDFDESPLIGHSNRTKSKHEFLTTLHGTTKSESPKENLRLSCLEASNKSESYKSSHQRNFPSQAEGKNMISWKETRDMRCVKDGEKKGKLASRRHGS